MKIVIATAVYYPMINGVAVFSHNLARGLAKRGHEVLVLCPSQKGKSYSTEEEGVKTEYLRSVEVKIYPDQIHDLPEKRKLFGRELPRLFYRHGFKVSVFPQLEVKKILDRFNPDVVHVQVSDPIGLSVVWYAKKHGIPVVTTEHNQPEVLTDPIKMPGMLKKPANYLLAAYFRNRQGRSDFVTMPTEQAIRNLLAQRELKVPIAAVSNGVDLSSFQPGKAAAEIYQKYQIPQKVPIVLYVGRVDPEKQVGRVIDAFSKVQKKIPEAKLLIVGDGVDRERLEKKVARIGLSQSVRFLGKVLPPDLYEIYKVGTVFATASEIETQGIVLIEAAAVGLPLVAVNAGAVAEVCLNNKNGFLCRPKDTSGIARSLKKILENHELAQKFSQKSIEIAREHDFENTLDRFINIYRRVIES